MINLLNIKNYFKESIVVFPKSIAMSAKLSTIQKEIFYEIGLPNHKGYGGSYIMLDNLKQIGNKYIQFATREYDEDIFSQCLDIETGEIVFNFALGAFHNDYNFINSSIKSYLEYVYTYSRFRLEVKIPQKLGNYHERHSEYSMELKKQFQLINEDFKKGFWRDLIEEMDLGVI